MMNIERAIELLKIEKECVERGSTCDRKCAKCPLVQKDYELIDMYKFVIDYISGDIYKNIAV